MVSDEDKAKIHAFTRRLAALIEAEADLKGIGGVLVGYGAGFMLAEGSTEEDVRECFEHGLRELARLRNAVGLTE